MNVKSARRLILNYFEENDEKESICYDDFNKLIPTSANRLEAITSILGALVELSNQNYVYLNPLSDSQKPETLLWVMTEPLGNKKYKVEINHNLASNISFVVNNFLEQVDSDEMSDPSNLEERDFFVLLEIISRLSGDDDNNDNNDNNNRNNENPPELPLKSEKPPKNK